LTFIEQIFGISNIDGGNGTLELFVLLVLVVAIAVCAFRWVKRVNPTIET